MKKIIVLFTILALLFLIIACQKKEEIENVKNLKTDSKTVELKTETTENYDLIIPKINMQNIVKGIPENFDLEIPLLEDVTETYIDLELNNSNNVFYSSSASLEEIFKQYLELLSTTKYEVTEKKLLENSAYIKLQKNNKLVEIYLSDQIPQSYPAELNLSGRFINIMYNLEPLKPLSEILNQN